MKVNVLLKSLHLFNGQMVEIRECGKTLELLTNDEAHKTPEEHYKMATYGERKIGTYEITEKRFIVNILPIK